jgi:hypothetical protein
MFLQKSSAESKLQISITKLRYLAYISLMLIDLARKNLMYNEHLIEYSLISSYGIWRLNEQNLFVQEWNTFGKKVGYVKENLERKITSKDLLKIFQAHESNFLSAMDIKLVRELQEKGI